MARQTTKAQTEFKNPLLFDEKQLNIVYRCPENKYPL